MILQGKTAIITGANQGLGLEIAKQFVSNGANVVICARNKTLLDEANQTLLPLAKQNRILALTVDISNHTQVDDLVKQTLKSFGRIDVLVANAGVYGPKGAIEDVNWNDWEQAININLLGTVYLSRAVVPQMKQQSSGKIIFISGGGATKPMPNLSAYAVSKAGVVRFAETLAEELKAYNISVNSVAPGALNTRLLNEILEAGPDKVGKQFYEQSIKQQASGGTPLNVGAELCVFLASQQSDAITGKLISAVWDPWKTLNEYIQDIKTSDIYTLRRIVPSDRGKTWDQSK